MELSSVPSGQTMQVFSGHTGPVQAGTFTPDGKRLLTASEDGSLILWDPRSASLMWRLSAEDARFGMANGITSLAVNAAGTIAVVGGANGEVRVINMVKGEVLGKLEAHSEGDSIEAIEFLEVGGGSTNAGVVVTAGTDGKACIWDLTTMRLRVSVTHSVSRETHFPLSLADETDRGSLLGYYH
jgi:ribosome assembly protein SQT1